MAGGRIDIEVAPDFRAFPAQFRSGLSGVRGLASSIGRGLGTAVAVGAGVAAVGLKNVIQLGNEYQGNLNELQAVSQATGAEMVRVGQVAKALGGDLTLPATSAADAANAMVELAKGGLDVDEAMQAAKGTLQLAAAAQVDGATAAELQAAALNSFGLAADQAGRVADVLANTANASASSMIDVGNSLKYVAPVSAALKVSIEDTAAAIGLLANQGIKGEQAGTSLRGILASLASPSAAAKEGMDALGISAFDTQGKFVGLRAFTDQLAQAKGRLTDAEFAAASSTAFGNEGFTAANALAAEGAVAFDEMATSVSRAGGAADVAAAQTQGLGGAWEGFKSQLETAGIEVYEVIAPGLERATRSAAEFVGDFTPTVVRGIETAVAAGELFGPGLAQAIGSRADALLDAGQDLIEPLRDGIVDSLNSIANLGVTVFGGFAEVVGEGVDAVEPLTVGVGDLVEGLNEASGPVSALIAGLGLVYDATAGVIRIVAPAVDVVGDLVGMFGDLPGPIQTAVVAMLALQAGPALLGGLRSALSGAGQDAEEAGRRTGLFGRAVSLATSPVRLAASSLSSVTGTYRQFSDEMRVQRALAAASGTEVSRLGGAMAAFRTSTIPAISVMRDFGDQAAQIRAGAAAVEQPMSRLGAAIGVIVERSPALTAMRDTYRSTFATFEAASERAALAAGIATESVGPRLQNAVTRTREEFQLAGVRIGDFGRSVRSGVVSAMDAVAARTSAMVSAITAIPTGVGVAAISLQDRLAGAASRAGSAITSIPTAVGVAAVSLRDTLAGAASRAGSVLAAIPGQLAAFPGAIGSGVVGTLQRVPGAVTGAVSALGRLTAVAAGTGAALGRGLRSAASGLIGVLGGPWGVAIAAASVGLAFLADQQAEAKAKADQHRAAVTNLARALRDAGEAGEDIGDVLRSELQTALIDEFSGAADAADHFGISLTSVLDAATKGGTALDDLETKLIGIIKAGGGGEGSGFLSRNAEEAVKLLGALNELRTRTEEAEEANQRFAESADGSFLGATEQGMAFADAMNVLAAETSSADDKARALKQALDTLSGGTLSLEQAQARVNELLANMSDRFSNVENHADGFGKALLNADGSINTATENGRYLLDTVDDLGAAMADTAQKTFDAAQRAGDDIPTAMAKAKTAADGVRDSFLAQGEVLGLLPEQIQAIADRYGIVPDDVTTLINAPGMDSTQVELILLKSLVDQVPPNKAIRVESLSDAAKQKLLDLGFTVRTLPDGSVEVVANTAAAQNSLNTFVNKNKNRVFDWSVRISIPNIRGPAGLSGDGGFNALGNIVTPAYAHGGIHPKLTPMKAGLAAVVPPNSWRIVGDRLRDDEFYIPDNDDPRSVSLGLEWARRRGLVLARKFAEGGIAASNRQDVQQVVPAGTVVNMPISVQDNRSAYEVARVTSAELAFAARFGG